MHIELEALSGSISSLVIYPRGTEVGGRRQHCAPSSTESTAISSPSLRQTASCNRLPGRVVCRGLCVGSVAFRETENGVRGTETQGCQGDGCQPSDESIHQWRFCKGPHMNLMKAFCLDRSIPVNLSTWHLLLVSLSSLLRDGDENADQMLQMGCQVGARFIAINTNDSFPPPPLPVPGNQSFFRRRPCMCIRTSLSIVLRSRFAAPTRCLSATSTRKEYAYLIDGPMNREIKYPLLCLSTLLLPRMHNSKTSEAMA